MDHSRSIFSTSLFFDHSKMCLQFDYQMVSTYRKLQKTSTYCSYRLSIIPSQSLNTVACVTDYFFCSFKWKNEVASYFTTKIVLQIVNIILHTLFYTYKTVQKYDRNWTFYLKSKISSRSSYPSSSSSLSSIIL